MHRLILIGFLAGAVIAAEPNAAREWFLMVAKEQGMSDRGAEGLLKIIEQIDTEGFSADNMPSVPEVDALVAKLRPQIVEKATAMMCKKDGPRVPAVLDIMHQRAVEYMESQKTK
ncbi:uncharacterized protein LOC100900290 [Galendromus occidentalis]|uniref:Uncharacterized protein LOC100900290 n=1 Tax=Galendromus occidentalis TaxID=34638 RepID=A0AAJ6QMJ6_9ACAR|nr:uncharacterized protein LOC100900290 [Galendromus occidentalis]